jgi:hypothetical protein
MLVQLRNTLSPLCAVATTNALNRSFAAEAPQLTPIAMLVIGQIAWPDTILLHTGREDIAEPL